MKNILIIGANGFTGRRILNDLSVNPIYHVTGCSLRDDICPGKDYRFVRTDIRDENEVRKLFKECRPDIVINTAALFLISVCFCCNKLFRCTVTECNRTVAEKVR